MFFYRSNAPTLLTPTYANAIGRNSRYSEYLEFLVPTSTCTPRLSDKRRRAEVNAIDKTIDHYLGIRK